MYRISQLIRINRKLYHTNDLAVLWKIQDRNLLYKTISRFMKKGLLYQVYKGLYSIVPLSELNPLDLGRSINHSYTYLSTETVLAQVGAITQSVYDFTFIADKSKKITVGEWIFRYRQMKEEYLHHPIGISEEEFGFVASVERAAADMLYFSPKYHFDVPDLIDFEKVKRIQAEVGYAGI
jgi:predicted transcriptional regulator of viral defense system